MIDALKDRISALEKRVKELENSIESDPAQAATDLALLTKFATGEGGRRTGVLMREGLIKVTVTEKGCAALGGLDATTQKMAEGSITHADLLKMWERYGALYDAVFPGIIEALRASVKGDALNREWAAKMLAQIEAYR